MRDFDLTRNPFAILRTSPRATRAQLSEAYQDALLEAEDPADEANLDRAQQALAAPRERIDAELGYFVFAKPATSKALMGSLRRGETTNVASLIGIDRANMAAHLCATSNEERATGFVDLLLGSYQEIAADEVLDELNASRSVSGFGRIDEDVFRASLRQLIEQHAAAAISAILKSPRPGYELNSRIVDLTASEGARRQLLEAMLRHYERRLGALLETKAAVVQEKLASVRRNPSQAAALASFNEELRAWDDLAQPLQVADNLRGLDEQRSTSLYEAIREVALELANDRREHEAALALTRAALSAFAELPQAREQLQDDETTLEELVQADHMAANLAPLCEAVDVARQHHSRFARAMSGGGFGLVAAPPALEIRDCYDQIIRGGDQKCIESATMAVRSLAIELCNESNDNKSALKVLEWLLSYSDLSPSLRAKLGQDLRTVRRNLHFSELTSALQAGSWSRAETIIEQLRPESTSEEREQLATLEAQLQSRRRSQRFKFAFWGSLGALGLFAIVTNEPRSNTSSYDTEVPETGSSFSPEEVSENPDMETATVTAPSSSPESADLEDGTAITTTADDMDDQGETPPPPFQSGALTRSQLRYCQRQKERIEFAEGKTLTDPQIDRFNAAVSDYNLRCSSYKYNPGDMTVVQEEISSSQSQLEREGTDIVGEEY